jgi:hypothetical protein
VSDFWRLRLPVAKGGVTVTWQKPRCSQYPLNLGHRKRTPVLSGCGFILADTHGHKGPVLGNSALSGKFVTRCILLIAEHFVCAALERIALIDMLACLVNNHNSFTQAELMSI